MNFSNILTNNNLLRILNKTLENSATKNKISSISPEGEENIYNQYSLLIVMDFIIKYQIIIEDEKYDDEMLKILEAITKQYNNHQELVLSLNNLLVNIICKKLNIVDKENITNKKEIIKYLYDKYIVNGYFFHSFPSSLKKEIEENGITQQVSIKENSNLKQINHIFNNHNYKDIVGQDLDKTTRPINLTDSPALAYYYAFSSPNSLNEITSLSKYYNYLYSKQDKEAYYRKDYDACKSNLTMLCNHVNMTEKEKDSVLTALKKEWDRLDITNSKPSIAFIRRKDLSKDFLPNIEKILKDVENEDIVISISRITDSKYPVLRRYTNIAPLDLKVITMPSYMEIKNGERAQEKVKLVLSSEMKIEKEKDEINIPIKNNLKYSYGHANVIALLGLLSISLGITLSIILKVIGG